MTSTQRRRFAAVLVVTAAFALIPALHSTAAVAATSSAGCRTGRGTAQLPRTVDGRHYLLHAPKGHNPRSPLPLLLAFHGAKQTPAQLQRYSRLDRARAIVVYPEGRRFPHSTSRGWAPNDKLIDVAPDVRFTADLVTAVEKAFCISSHRVYATGKSEGGGFTYALACTRPGLVAAIAPVAGAFYRSSHHGIDPRTCRSGPLPVLDFHGDRDSVIDYHGTARSRPIRTGTQGLGWVDEWVARDRCRVEQDASAPKDVRLHVWSHCAPGARVVQYRLVGAGHTWPGSKPHTSGGGKDVTNESVSATSVMLRFFGIGTSS